ncbi:cyanophycinase [Aquimarina sp. MMG015]|uniref:cyanophycinase n=1 Tax=Aquimarina sp. MMG015 TaxID=2822689 RepID=UPI001B3A53B1|nr:cyanophycinase [Aquimarina sp. MMG015]MBQ4804547.1 cyanophycinase [Aquimarina sp. MMG015]
MKTKGTLLIMGGNCTNDFFISEFAGLAGGIESKVVIIPTAMEDKYIDSVSDLNFLKKPFIDFGFKNIDIIHTRETKVANSDFLNKKLLTADAVWIAGGRQWRLAKVYNGTKIQNSLKTLLNQGKVIAGTSAGASIMGDVLVRGDSKNHTIMLGDYKNGFGFVTNLAIDQHHIARNRQFDMFELKKERPNVLGIGIDENTGIVLHKNKFRVLGKSYVTIYDNTRWSEERDTIYQLDASEKQFYTLTNGYEYDIVRRKVIQKNDRKKLPYKEDILRKITGTYQQSKGLKFGQDLRITIVLEENELYFEQSWNKVKYRVDYHYLNTFFRPNSISTYHFNKDKTGAFSSFLFFQYAYGVSNWVKM